MKKPLILGFEIGSGSEVAIPLKHMAITGQTQEAGKTTALEGLIMRSGLRAVTFITKRGEASFTKARRIDPYFREETDWQFVASILEASRGEKLKFERAWIIRASKNARTLADVQRNVQTAMEKARGMSADVYLTLDAYLEVVVPQISKIKWAKKLELEDGINVVDLTGISVEMQHLVIKSTITWVLEKEKDTIVVIPEAWKFIPQGRNTPVKLAAESFIRQAAALDNFLWLDSQDIAGVDKIILKSVPVWILGVQREANEIKRTLDNIPDGMPKLKPSDISTLGLGQFYACWGRHAIKTYVQPTWLDEKSARMVAQSLLAVERVRKFEPDKPKERNMAVDQQVADLQREIRDLTKKLADAIAENNRLSHKSGGEPEAPVVGGKVNLGDVDINATERAVNITFNQEKREFTTDGPTGMFLFCLIHDLGNSPSTESQVSAKMQERGWSYSHQTLSPMLAKLVNAGDLIKEGATRAITYRLPGKLILTIDGDTPKNLRQ